VLLAGAIALVVGIRRRRAATPAAALSEEEAAALAELEKGAKNG
jgi:cytochrome c-type biogenesis protein CcmH/NrfF